MTNSRILYGKHRVCFRSFPVVFPMTVDAKQVKVRGNAFLAKGWAEWLRVLPISVASTLFLVHRRLIVKQGRAEHSWYLAREQLYVGSQSRWTERQERRNKELKEHYCSCRLKPSYVTTFKMLPANVVSFVKKVISCTFYFNCLMLIRVSIVLH